MKDVTKLFMEGSDTHAKVSGSRLMRNDLLLNKLKNMQKKLNLNRPIVTTVYDQGEFVESMKGSIRDTEEIIKYYSENFILKLSMVSKRNEVIVRIEGPLKEEVASDDEN